MQCWQPGPLPLPSPSYPQSSLPDTKVIPKRTKINKHGLPRHAQLTASVKTPGLSGRDQGRRRSTLAFQSQNLLWFDLRAREAPSAFLLHLCHPKIASSSADPMGLGFLPSLSSWMVSVGQGSLCWRSMGRAGRNQQKAQLCTALPTRPGPAPDLWASPS